MIMTELGTAGISMALGQIEEAMGLLDGRKFVFDLYHAYKALVRARDLLHNAMQAQQVAVFEAPIRGEEIRS